MLSQSLVDTYLGRISGRRVLDGSIKRGDSDLIDAVIWFSDLRNSTRLAESLGHEKFLALLDDYFDASLAVSKMIYSIAGRTSPRPFRKIRNTRPCA